MGRGERLGELRGSNFFEELEIQRRSINNTWKAIDHVGKGLEFAMALTRSQDARIAELEAELRFRLLPFWRRWPIQVRYGIGFAYGWCLGLRDRIRVGRDEPQGETAIPPEAAEPAPDPEDIPAHFGAIESSEVH